MHPYRAMPPRRGLFLLLSLLLFAAMEPCAAADNPFASAVTEADVDWDACRILIDGKPYAPSEERKLRPGVLGIGADYHRYGWGGGKHYAHGEERDEARFDFLLVFKKPVEVGSVLFFQERLGRGEMFALKPDANDAPDPAVEGQWLPVEFPSHQSKLRLATLPAGFRTRAFRWTEIHDRGNAAIHQWRILKRRLYNVTPFGAATGQAEYTSYPDMGSPHTFRASHIVTAGGSRGQTWKSHGPDKEGVVRNPTVDETFPIWFVLAWDEPRPIAGFILESNFEQFDVKRYEGPAGVPPAAALKKEWKRISNEAVTRGPAGNWWVDFPPEPTRGIRLLATKTNFRSTNFASIESLVAVVDIGADAPVPEGVSDEPDHPPYGIAYALPEDGILSLRIEDAEGKVVRNLIGRNERKGGDNKAWWDLKDDDGQVVPPGDYKWQALFHPPLSLKYQMTPYPNIVDNAPMNSPWLNGHNGPGGWLADHTPPVCVAAGGERVYAGAPTAESGVALAECTLDGQKLWGHHNFASWTGPSYLATDDKYLYVGAPGWLANGYQERVWRIEKETKEKILLIEQFQTERRRRGIAGLEAMDGKVYLSIRGPDPWLQTAVQPDDVDSANCYPRYKILSEKEAAEDDAADPARDFMRLFRLKETPPGQPRGKSLIYLESTSYPSRKQYIVLAFKKPVPLGSLVFPAPETDDKMSISLLKADAPYPPRPRKESDWQTFYRYEGQDGFLVVPCPEGATTRALRITFARGVSELDELAGLDEEEDQSAIGGIGLLEGGARSDPDLPTWTGRLEGMKLLRRRFRPLLEGMTVKTNSGAINEYGEWYARRDRPPSESDPALYMMQWNAPQPVRGLAIKEIDAKRVLVDAWIGKGAPAIDADAGWEAVGSYKPTLRNYYSPTPLHNSAARYMDGYVDFERDIETRAVRVRIVETYAAREWHRPLGVRRDRGADNLEPNRVRVYGITPVAYLGGEAEVDQLLSHRLEVWDRDEGKLVDEAPLVKPGPIAKNPEGMLYALSDKRVVRIDPANLGASTPVIDDLLKPTALACGPAGNLYVYDKAPDRHVVRVYAPSGKHLRDIGQPGGFRPGPWVADRMGNVTDIDVDRRGQLWIAEKSKTPKRVACWSAEGKHVRDILGPTAYGGGGCLDPYDPARLFYGPMEFALERETGATQLAHLTWNEHGKHGQFQPSAAGELPIRIDGRTYMVTRPMFGRQAAGVVYLYEDGTLRRVAAVGNGSGFAPLRDASIVSTLDGKSLDEVLFHWTDRNGDGGPQPEEVTWLPLHYKSVSWFDRTLGIQAAAWRFAVTGFTSDGAPQYELRRIPGLPTNDPSRRLPDGNYFCFRGAGYVGQPADCIYSPDGKLLYAYPTEGYGVHALYKATPWKPSQVVAEFDVIGVETIHAGDLGLCIVTNNNVGCWSIFSGDGFLAGSLFRDIRDPKRQAWSMREHDRGMELRDVTAGQEHFSGYFCKTVENRYYVVAGHNHASVVEIEGLDKFQRLGGAADVSADDLKAAQAWEREAARKARTAAPRIIDCNARGRREIAIDGDSSDWSFVSASIDMDETQYNDDENLLFRMAYDKENLYLCYEIRNHGPMKNTGEDWRIYFKSGACADFQIGVDPSADPARKKPGPGDLRVLMTQTKSGPEAVLYQPVAPDATEDEHWTTATMVHRVGFDRVRKLTEARVTARANERGYVLEAAIPLAAIGLKIEPGLRLRMDWGILESGKDGNEVMQRIYWSNKATSIVSDVAFEATLQPDLWGFVRFSGKAGGGNDPLNAGNLLGGEPVESEPTLDDIEAELEGLD